MNLEELEYEYQEFMSTKHILEEVMTRYTAGYHEQNHIWGRN